ncbi:MAG: arylesterase [Thermoanaerobaculia bacterium]|nr:arylesterase [Thermoanaerobaculia bacterium]
MQRPPTTRPTGNRPATHAGATRRPSASKPSLLSDRRIIVGGAVALLLVLVWLFWPSPYSKVKNLASNGSSVVAFGDSLTAGYGVSNGEDYPSKLSARTGVAILNAGVSGDTTEAALARIDEDVLSRGPRIVIVGLGGNDFLRGVPIAATETNLRTIVRKIQGAGGMVVLLGFTFPSISSNYGKMYERVAEEEGCLLVPELLEGIMTNPSLKSDEIHPNAPGYALMAERVEGPLKELISRANGAR